MPLYPQIYVLAPAAKLAVVLERSRPTLRRLHADAFSAMDECRGASKAFLAAFGVHVGPPARPPDLIDDSLALTMFAAERRAQALANAILLLVDDALGSYARRLYVDGGVGSAFGPSYGGVHLSSLLRAATNAIRHAAEWADDPDVPGPADPRWNESDAKRAYEARRALKSIRPLCAALNLGERVNDYVSIETLIVVDGRYGSEDGVDYARFEAAVVQAARDIADDAETIHGLVGARKALDAELVDVLG
jgi:hypothetical protein